MGSSAGGPAGSDDGGAAAVEVGAAGVLTGAVGVAVVVVVVVGVGAAELLVGAGAGGPKQPVNTIRPESPRTLNAGSLGLVLMPPWVRPSPLRDPLSSYA